MNANLFIMPLDNQQTWYRYHTLFADMLRKRLHDSMREDVHELHRRASHWYRDNGLIDVAITHALLAQDYELAAGLIEQIAETYLKYGEAVTLLGWLEDLPKEIILAHSVLGSLKGMAMILCGKPPQAVNALLQEMTIASNQDEFQGESTTLRALLVVLQGRSAEAIHLSEQALQQLPAEHAFFRSLAADSLGMAYTLAGDIEAAARAFELVVEISRSDNVDGPHGTHKPGGIALCKRTIARCHYHVSASPGYGQPENRPADAHDRQDPAQPGRDHAGARRPGCCAKIPVRCR
jgi:LuxR family maltose regulon positive regulatory protein